MRLIRQIRQMGPMLVMAGLLLGGCANTERTPQAMTYDTLQQSRIFVDAYMSEFDAAVSRGEVSLEKQIEVNQAYVQVLEGIRAVAVTVRDGVDPQTPDDVRRLVQNLVNILVVIVPPPTQ